MGIKVKCVSFFIVLFLFLIIKYKGIIGIKTFLGQKLLLVPFWHIKVYGYHGNWNISKTKFITCSFLIY